MTLPTVRQLCFLCALWFLGCLSSADARPYDQWEDGVPLRPVRGIQSGDYSDVIVGNQDEDQVQNVFKRFLFHYSKARNSVGPVQQLAGLLVMAKGKHDLNMAADPRISSHSVHPLLRLSPKLSKRKNKKVLLLAIRDLPEGML